MSIDNANDATLTKAGAEKCDEGLFARVMSNNDAARGQRPNKADTGDIPSVTSIANSYLPKFELLGFDQEAPYKSQGAVKDALHSVKHLFFSDPSLQDKIKEKVESQMSPQEKARYEAENKALEQYQDKLRQWQVQETINRSPMPAAPDTPMHREVDKRVQQVERQITETVRSKMSSEDIRRLNDQFGKFNREALENPCGTDSLSDCYRPRNKPEPQNAIKDYYDRLAEDTQKYLEGK